MKAIVLIGGFGTRLRPVTYELPKQLIPIAGKPMLQHVLDLLPHDLEEAVLATGYKSEEIAEAVSVLPLPFPVRCVPEAEPLGTGGGMRNAGDAMSDPFLLVNSDVIADASATALLSVFRERGGTGAMSLTEVEDPEPYGVAELGEQDRIVRFVEKPPRAQAPSRWINAGLSVWSREVLERIPRGRAVSFERETVPLLLPVGIYGYRLRGYWEDAGTPARLLNAQRLLFDDGRDPAADRWTGGPHVSVARGAEVGEATLGPYVTIGAAVRLGRGARVEDSIVMSGARIGAGATVVRSLLGPGVEVAEGERVADQVLARPGVGPG